MKKYKNVLENQKLIPVVIIALFIFTILISHTVSYIDRNFFDRPLDENINYTIYEQVNSSLYKRLYSKNYYFFDYAIKSYKINSNKDEEPRAEYRDKKDDESLISAEVPTLEDRIAPRYLTNILDFKEMDPRDIKKKGIGLTVTGSYENKKLLPLTIKKDDLSSLSDDFDLKILDKIEKSFINSISDSYTDISNDNIKSLIFYYNLDFSKDSFKDFYNIALNVNYLKTPTIIVSIAYLILIFIYALAFKLKYFYGKTVDFLAKIPFELYLLISVVLFSMMSFEFTNFPNIKYFGASSKVSFTLVELKFYIVLFIFSILLFVLTEEAKDLLKNKSNSKTYKNIFVVRLTRFFSNKFSYQNLSSIRLVTIYFVLILLGLLLVSMNISSSLYLFIFWVIFITFLLFYHLKNARNFEKILNFTKKLSNGNFDDKLENIEGYENFVENLNLTGRNLDKILNEKLESEKFKSELITNVSHDLKTPLTSIINYSSLLNDDNLSGEEIKKYSKIILDKSLKIKDLIEDLFEVSKINSGSIEVHKVLIRLDEMLSQMAGEWEDKLKSREIELIMKMSQSEVYFELDPELLYRILQNIFSNIYKYAKPTTRVYVDLYYDKEVMLIFKNISNEKLNISSKELFERFVRGDKSRKTEGSGIGLSIAKSLVEVQGGSFQIDIDGDLFKQTIILK